jgi:hypothetical protein
VLRLRRFGRWVKRDFIDQKTLILQLIYRRSGGLLTQDHGHASLIGPRRIAIEDRQVHGNLPVIQVVSQEDRLQQGSEYTYSICLKPASDWFDLARVIVLDVADAIIDRPARHPIGWLRREHRL